MKRIFFIHGICLFKNWIPNTPSQHIMYDQHSLSECNVMCSGSVARFEFARWSKARAIYLPSCRLGDTFTWDCSTYVRYVCTSYEVKVSDVVSEAMTSSTLRRICNTIFRTQPVRWRWTYRERSRTGLKKRRLHLLDDMMGTGSYVVLLTSLTMIILNKSN